MSSVLNEVIYTQVEDVRREPAESSVIPTISGSGFRKSVPDSGSGLLPTNSGHRSVSTDTVPVSYTGSVDGKGRFQGRTVYGSDPTVSGTDTGNG